MSCAICQTRRPRRFCPGVGGDICSICCGTEREVTVNCPLDCEFLREARNHEKPAAPASTEVPHRDIRISDQFLRENEGLAAFLGQAIANAAFDTRGAVDFDVREALESLIRTYRTLQSGVYYESLPQNPLAANIYRVVQGAIAEFRRQEQQALGISKTRDADVLGMLVFFARIEIDRNNGRPKGRAFLDTLRGFYSGGPEAPEPPGSAPSLILP